MYKININILILITKSLIILLIYYSYKKYLKVNKIDEVEYVRFCKEFEIEIFDEIEGSIN